MFGKEDIGYDHCILGYGNIGKGEVNYFNIELEDDEEFDINKLHFFDDPWWYDCEISEAADRIEELFGEHSVLLDFVEYDGKIYCCDDANYMPGYKDCGDNVYVTTYMEPDTL